MYPQALARAKSLDEQFARTGKLQGPMHGVPVSVKDQCRVKGTETTCGFISNLGVFDQENSLLVDMIQDAGAVVFCKTSLSVGCMWGETNNEKNAASSAAPATPTTELSPAAAPAAARGP